MAAINKLISAGVECGSEDAPDDMTLGMWLKHLEIPIVHSPLFHQVCLTNQDQLLFWSISPAYLVTYIILCSISCSRPQVAMPVDI